MKELGAAIRKTRERLRFSREKLYAMTNVSVSTIKRMEEGKPTGQASVETVMRWLGLQYDWSTGEFLTKADEKTIKGKGRGIPIVGNLSGGPLMETVYAEHTEGDKELPLPLESFPGCVAARVVGSSMSPKYNHGDWVILREVRCEDVKTGYECYFEIQGAEMNGGTLKKAVVLDGDRLLLLPINDGQHEPIEARCSDVRMVRRAIGKYVPFVENFGFDS